MAATADMDSSFYFGDTGKWFGNMFRAEKMYEIVRELAEEFGMEQTLCALPYAWEKHEGQFRKGREKIPYIVHPLMMACHAKAIGFREDELFAAILLHDVVEDCGVTADELPVSREVQEAVALVSKGADFHTNPKAEEEYYRRIGENRLAVMVKMLDRVNNVSGMASGFTQGKLENYIRCTEQYFYPMMEDARHRFPEYASAVFLIRYHMMSVVESLRCQIYRDGEPNP